MVRVIESYNPVSNILRSVLEEFIIRTGRHDGGDCATIAKFITDYLDEINEDYSFSGEIVDDGLSHVLVKYKGKYYDAVEGLVNTAGCLIVDNLEDDGTAIGNDEYGWIDYKLGTFDYRTTSSYQLFNEIIDELS